MLKIGVLGAGNLGKTHIRLLQEIGDYQLIGFYDPVKTTAETVARDYSTIAFPSAELLLEECDVIDITTPTSQYYKIAEKAIRLSKHVFLEKPFTTSVGETKSLMRLAAEANNKVQVGHIERFNPAFMASRKHIADPFYIETQRLCPFNHPGETVSVVMDLMINDIAIVLSLVRSNIKKISASGVVVVSDSPDIVNARLEFDNGAVANLTASRISQERKHHSSFFRRDAYVTVDFLGNTAGIVSLEVQKSTENRLESFLEEGRYSLLNNMILDRIEVTPSDAIKMQLESFSTAIINNTRPLVPIDDGYNALGVANKIIDQLLLNANFAAAHTIIA